MTISGHVPAPGPGEGGRAHSDAAEHDWGAASSHVFPALRPAGTQGVQLATLHPEQLALEGTRKHALALLDPGPADLLVVYVLRTEAYDIVINADHLLTWGIAPDALRDAAMDNLRDWSASAPWSEELTDERQLRSSDTGDGGDAARILLPEVRRHLAARAGEGGGGARVLIALPDRDLLVAASVDAGDSQFAAQLATFILDVFDDAHEPIDRRLFELVGEEPELVPFAT